MPFLRLVRDKRGYEYFWLVHQTSGRRGKVRQQVLYWFRTPPNLKVGRQAFDEDVMHALEAQYPDVQFDWEALRDTPPLLPPVEPWRERRRAERAARQVHDADEEAETTVVEAEPAAAAQPIPLQSVPEDPEDPTDSTDSADLKDVVQPESPVLAAPVVQAALVLADGVDNSADDGSDDGGASLPLAAEAGAPVAVRRRRHRRRGRRGPATAPGLSGEPSGPTESAAAASIERMPSVVPDDEE